VQFEAMIAIGGDEGAGAFEAESVDVSNGGMRLRTAYLPEVGAQLVFRFDGPEGEIVAQAEVIWAAEEARGGEFAVKFIDVDDETMEALRALTAPEAGAEEEPAAEPKPNLRGTRVKLHIEGLASPMKARIKEGDDAEICVGSSLEFLKLGRHVEVEDVDHGARKEGFVDSVKVEIDPATSVPQLVVSLRFDGAVVGAPILAAAAQPARKSVAPKPIVAADAHEGAAPTAANKSAAIEDAAPVTKVTGSKRASIATDVAAATQTEPAEDDDEFAFPPNRVRAAQEKAKEMGAMAAAKIGPAFSKMGASAKGLFGALSQKITDTKQARDDAKKTAGPRRVTAPPPSGALTSDGRRLVRQDAEDEEVLVPVVRKKSKKGVVVGAAAGLALLVCIVGVTKAFSHGDAEAPALVATAQDLRSQTAAQMPPIPGTPATADIPLLGATPLSTTEQVTPPPASTAKVGVGDAEEEGADDAAAKPEKEESVREWGKGEVSSARVLKIKMDGPIAGFVGKESDDGFTIVVPGRKPLSSTSGLMRKDKRISAMDVVPMEAATEITIHFKGETPSYLAKIRGDRLEIALSGGGSKAAAPKKVAKKKSTKKSSKKTSAKKK